MIRKKRYVATHIDTDTAADKRDEFSLYGAVNAEVVSNGKNLSLSPTKIKAVYNNVTSFINIVGSVIVNNVLYIFDHTTNAPYPDIIYKVTSDKVIVKITAGDYGFTNSTNMDVVGNKETDNLIKLYWADGVNQLRTLNVAASVPDGTNADIVMPVTLSMPYTILELGGSLKAGNIQYAYTLFNLNGSETNISPLSLPVHVLKTVDIGGVSGEVLNRSVSVIINPVDLNFEYIRVYSIHYQEENQLPRISLISETEISSSYLSIIDDGNLFIADLSLDQFTFLGGVLIIPQTIATKNNRLIAANYKSTNFDVPFSVLTDPRVYGHKGVFPAPVNFTGKEEFDYVYYGSIVHTKTYGTPVNYIFADGKVDNKTGIRQYEERYENVDGPRSLAADIDTTVTLDLSKTFLAGTYKKSFRTSSNGPATNITGIVDLYLNGAFVQNIYADTRSYFNSNYVNSDNFTASSTFNQIRYRVTKSNPSASGGMDVQYMRIQYGYQIIVPTSAPPDDILYGSYTVSSVEHNTLTVNGVSKTPTSVTYNAGNSTYFFDSVFIPLIALGNVTVVSSLKLAGTRSPITVTTITVAMHINVSSPQYFYYNIVAAVASGQMHVNDGFNSFSLDIDNSSFVNITDILTLTHNVTGGYPIEGLFTVTLDLLTTDGDYQLVAGPAVSIKNKGGADELFLDYTQIPKTHDCINTNTAEFNLQADLVTIGYGGTNFKFHFVSEARTFISEPLYNSLKQGETYRIGIVYYNRYGQRSPVKWMCDVLVPYYAPNYHVQLVSTFIGTAVNFTNVGVVKYQLTIVKREPKDISVSSPGFLMPGADYNWLVSGERASPSIHPYYTLKRLYDLGGKGGSLQANYTAGKDFPATPNESAAPTLKKDLFFFYSGDTALGLNSIKPATKIHILGTLKNSLTGGKVSIKRADIVNGSIINTEVENGVVPPYDGYTMPGYPEQLMTQGVAGRPVVGGVAEHIFSWEFDLFQPHGAIPDDNIVTLKVASINLERSKGGYIDGESVSNLVNIINMLDKNNASNAMSYAATFIDSVALKFLDTTWHRKVPASGNDYDRFSDNINNYGILLAELIHYTPNQYGGNTYEDKKRNSYMLNGNYVDIGNLTNQYQPLGDVTIARININRSDGLDTKSNHYWNLYEYITTLPMETNSVLSGRNDKMVDFVNSLNTTIVYGTYRLVDNHKLLGAYNQQNTLILGLPIPPAFNIQETFSNSVMASKEKFPNETIDSWTDFLVNDTMNLMGIYGPIVKIYNFRNEIFAYQTRAVCALIINPRVQIQSNDGVGVELGTGTFLYRFEYLTTVSGTIFKSSIVDDGASMYYYDNVSKSINMHDGAELSTLKSIRQLMLDAILTDQTNVRSLYDIGKKQVIMTFDSFSLVYDKLMEFFIRTEGYHVKAVAFDNKVLSVVSSKLNEHYAGSLYNELTLKYMMAPDPVMEKVFHNLDYRKSGKNTITYIRVDDKNGRIGEQSNPEIYNKFNINRLHLPRVNDSIDRFRDVSILVTLKCPESAESFFLDDMIVMYNVKG